jgi:hypothetical protein
MARRLLTKEGEEEIAVLYPQFQPILSKWRMGGEVTWFSKGQDWGKTPSVYRDFIHRTLKTMANHPNFPKCTTDWTRSLWIPQHIRKAMWNSLDLIDLHPDLWKFASNVDIKHLQHISGDGQ